MSSDELQGQKRRRLETDLFVNSFGENRMKRRKTATSCHLSPNLNLPAAPNLSCNTYFSHQNASTIVSASLDYDMSIVLQSKAFLSPCTSSSGSATLPLRNDHISSGFDGNPPSGLLFTDVSLIPPYRDDLEMSDCLHVSSGSYRHESSTNTAVAGRVPTPICSTFTSVIGTDKINLYVNYSVKFYKTVANGVRRGKRLPSPVSEGEISPSTIVTGFSDMQVEVETTSPLGNRKENLQNRISSSSKNCLKDWITRDQNVKNMTKSFTMGYRADCEKCRMKVPGHFSHIISS